MKKIVKRLKALVNYIDDILLALGAGFISLGGFLIYIPAGFIILGICLVAYAFMFAWLNLKGGKK